MLLLEPSPFFLSVLDVQGQDKSWQKRKFLFFAVALFSSLHWLSLLSEKTSDFSDWDIAMMQRDVVSTRECLQKYKDFEKKVTKFSQFPNIWKVSKSNAFATLPWEVSSESQTAARRAGEKVH